MKIDRVLLIAPPLFTFRSPRDVNPVPPMGLGYLASVVERMGIEVNILDCLLRGWNNEEDVNDLIVRVGLPDSAIVEHIRAFNPDIIGISCQFSRQYKIYHHLFSLVKEASPGSITVAGGAHVTVCAEEVLGDPNCDFVLLGEAEESFRDFVECLIDGTNQALVDGLGWKVDGTLKINPKKRWIIDLNSIPFPSYQAMDLESYFGLAASHGYRRKSRFCPVITSRGCPAKCTFCSANRVWGNRYRVRSVDNVLEEMRILKKKYGIEELMFEDDNVTAHPGRAKELFSRMFEEQFNFVWDTPNGVGVWSMDEEMIDLMKKSGCIKLNFPIESGSQPVLDKIIQKPLKLEKVRGLIEHCKRINLDFGIFLVVGMPGETIDDIWKSFHFAADCGCYNPLISIATPYPGTKLYENCMENGLFSRPFTLDDLFIRSFMVETSDWRERDLRMILLKGHLYLIYRGLLKHPGKVLSKIARFAGSPSMLIGYLKRILP